MEVILLEKIRNLGDIGAKVSVKSGYARNYLVPYGKAVTATQANLEKFAKMREELERNAALSLKLAKDRATKLEQVIIIVKKGSASKNYKVKDIKNLNSFVVDKNYIELADTLLVHANKKDLEIFKKLNSSREFLGKISKTCRGLPFQKEVTKAKTTYPVYCGQDISKYNQYL